MSIFLGPDDRSEERAAASDVQLRQSGPTDFGRLFEPARDPVSAHPATFAANDPNHRAAVDRDLRRILADPSERIRIVRGGANDRSPPSLNDEPELTVAVPESGRKVYATHVARVSKVMAVPIRYAYQWSTDYRPDDGKLSRSRPRYRVLQVSNDRIVRVRISPRNVRPLRVTAELIRLRPPDAWHLDQIDEEDLNSVDYKLTRLGPKTTRITLDLVERWMVRDHPTKAEWVHATNGFWDRLVAAVEKRYRQGLPARG